jgi:urocanate hydratase
MTFQEQILQRNSFGFTKTKPYDTEINHAPKRKKSFSDDEKKKLALKRFALYLNQNIMPITS